MKRKNHLLFAQAIAHLSIIPMILWGHWYHYLISFGVYFLTGCLGMSMTYHRLLSHRSWNAPLWFERLGSLLATLGLTGSSIAWCAVHREHHWNADQPGDPHSPLYMPFWKVQFLSMSHPPRVRYVAELIRDPFQRFLHRRYWMINLAYALVLFAINPFSVIYAYLFPAFVLWNAGSFINTIGHLFGYQNFNTKDSSRNNLLLGYLMWGEGWHNNHHRHQKNPYFGVRWFELDVSGVLIKFVRKLQFQLPSPPAVARSKISR